MKTDPPIQSKFPVPFPIPCRRSLNKVCSCLYPRRRKNTGTDVKKVTSLLLFFRWISLIKIESCSPIWPPASLARSAMKLEKWKRKDCTHKKFHNYSSEKREKTSRFEAKSKIQNPLRLTDPRIPKTYCFSSDGLFQTHSLPSRSFSEGELTVCVGWGGRGKAQSCLFASNFLWSASPKLPD